MDNDYTMQRLSFNQFSVNLSNSLPSAYDQEMATLLLLIYLLPPPPRGKASPKISPCDAVERLVVFHKVTILSSELFYISLLSTKLNDEWFDEINLILIGILILNESVQFLNTNNLVVM